MTDVRLTKEAMRRAGFKSNADLACVMGRTASQVSRWLADPHTVKDARGTPPEVWAILYLWPLLAPELQAAMLRGDHLPRAEPSAFANLED